MNQYCEVKLVNVLPNKNKTARKVNDVDKKGKTISVEKQIGFNKGPINAHVHTNKLVGGNENKRSTRSSKTFLITSQSQHYLITPSKTVKEKKVLESLNENNLQEQQNQIKKRQRSNEGEGNKSRRKRYKLEDVPEIVDACKNADFFSNESGRRKKKATKRKKIPSMFWESTLTGAKRVSKRLSNLRAENKTKTVNNKSMVIKKFIENKSMLKKPRAKRFTAMKATNNKYVASTDNEISIKMSTLIECQPKQQKYRKSSLCTRQLSPKISSDNRALEVNSTNENLSITTAFPSEKATKDFSEQDIYPRDDYIEEINGKDCFSICSESDSDDKNDSDRTADINEKAAENNVVPINCNSQDDAIVHEASEQSSSSQDDAIVHEAFEQKGSSCVPDINNDGENTTEVVLLESEEIKYIDNAEVIVVALEPVKDEAVFLDGTLVESCEKQQFDLNSMLSTATANVTSDRKEFDLSETTTDQQPKATREEEKSLNNPEVGMSTKLEDDDTFAKENEATHMSSSVLSAKDVV